MVKLGDWISEGVNMIKDQLWSWVLVMLLYFIIYIVAYSTCFGMFLVPGILMFGTDIIALKQIRGGRVEIGDMFSGFGLILPALGFACIIFLIAIPSMLFLGLPLLFIIPLWMFVPHLIIDRKMGLIDAMKASQNVVMQDYWWFLLMNFVIRFLAGMGAYACYVGLLVTYPLISTALAAAYRDCFGCEGAYSFKTEDMKAARGMQ